MAVRPRYSRRETFGSVHALTVEPVTSDEKSRQEG